MNYSSPGGWRDRLKKTNERQSERDAKAEIRAERARMDIEKAVADQAQAALNDAAVAATKCACPVCDAGTITVELAERVYRALQRLPSDSRPDPEIMSSLARIAVGEANHGWTPRVALGLNHPRAIEQPVEPVQVVQATPNKGRKSNKINRLTDDGAIIELDD